MQGWMAGGVVTRTIAGSLKSVGIDVVYAANSLARVPEGIRGVSVPAPHYFPLEWSLRRWLGKLPKEMIAAELDKAGATVIFPVVESIRNTLLPTIGWIPDFQHQHLPDLFSLDQRRGLNRRFRRLAERSRLVWMSSENAAADFRRTFPGQSGKVRVASFPSLLAYETPGGNCREVLVPYRLPEKFLLVVNQFWRHKNHRVVAEALGILKNGGLRISAVMAGLPADHRDRENSALSETLQALAKGKVWADCLVLGKIPRAEIEALLQRASVLVQPSRFEGWNTSVEDAKALGCPVILSDIAVHREQCPGALGFFDCDSPQRLAEILSRCWEALPARPDRDREQAALRAAYERGLEFGQQVAAFCREAST